MPRTPEGPPPPPAVQRLRIRYAKRGRLRFSSHRDFQRALERALRRAAVPMAYSAGFNRHPKISYAGAASTGAASEAEYIEIALTEPYDPEVLRQRLDASLPPGLDVLEVVDATSSAGALADRLEASRWQIQLPGADPAVVRAAAATFLAAEAVEVTRMMKNGLRTYDARSAVLSLTSATAGGAHPSTDSGAGGEDRLPPPGVDDGGGPSACAILELVVRHGQPSVRPDDVLTGLRLVADFVPPAPPMVTRLAQGPLDPQTGAVTDPLAKTGARS